LYIKLQFKSFFKINHINKYKEVNNCNNKIYSINFVPLLLILFIYNKMYLNFENLKHQIDCNIFFLPIKKKSIIFLRAPYKNKLARLNILNLEYTLIISFKLKFKNAKFNYSNYLTVIKRNPENFSTHKIKHTKTKIHINTFHINNFKINYFL